MRSTTPDDTALPSPWLFSPSWDLAFGYGLAYLVSVPLFVAATLGAGGGDGPLWLTGVLAIAFSTPHYGATLLRVYESRRERRGYALFTVWLSLLLLGMFVVGLHSPWFGSVLLTAYVTWGIWHFSAQNYGIAVLYLRRRGLTLPPRVKRPLYASFAFSAVLAIASVYVLGSSLSFAAGSQDASGTFRVFQLAVPLPVRRLLDVVVVAGYFGSLTLLVARLRGQLPLRQLGPVGLLLLTQALWFAVPAIGTMMGSWSSHSTGYAFAAIWISTAHAIQYLWISTYYARRAGRCTNRGPYFLKCLLAGAAITAPALFLAPGLFGGVAIHGSAIVVLVFTVVNLHHFVLDSAIWRLRDGRVARLLLRPQIEEPVEAAAGWPWARALVFGVGALVMGQQLYGAWAIRLVQDETVSSERQERAARHLHWLGLDTPDVWLSVGNRAHEAGRLDAAIGAYRDALGMYADAPPEWAMNRLAQILLAAHGDIPTRVAEAEALARTVAERLGDSHPEGQQTLAAALAASERWREAVLAAEWAVLIANAQGDVGRLPGLQATLADYRAQAALATGGGR